MYFTTWVGTIESERCEDRQRADEGEGSKWRDNVVPETIRDVVPYLHEMRLVKTDEEIAIMRHAALTILVINGLWLQLAQESGNIRSRLRWNMSGVYEVLLEMHTHRSSAVGPMLASYTIGRASA